jgi:C-terminal processing protease CtpA/Prc
MDLDEDEKGNVFVKTINPKSFAEKSGKVFVGDRVAMVQAVFGEDMWSVRGAGLTRVVSCIKLRNNKPTKIVLEAATEAEEKKRRAIAYAEASEEEKKLQKIKADKLLADIIDDDKDLLKKRKGLFGLW